MQCRGHGNIVALSDKGLNARNLVQCLQYLILILYRPIFKREKKGLRSTQKESKIFYIKLLEDHFSLEGTIKWLRKGER